MLIQAIVPRCSSFQVIAYWHSFSRCIFSFPFPERSWIASLAAIDNTNIYWLNSRYWRIPLPFLVPYSSLCVLIKKNFFEHNADVRPRRYIRIRRVRTRLLLCLFFGVLLPPFFHSLPSGADTANTVYLMTVVPSSQQSRTVAAAVDSLQSVLLIGIAGKILTRTTKMKTLSICNSLRSSASTNTYRSVGGVIFKLA